MVPVMTDHPLMVVCDSSGPVAVLRCHPDDQAMLETLLVSFAATMNDPTPPMGTLMISDRD